MKTEAQKTLRDLNARNRLKAKLAKRPLQAAEMTGGEKRHLAQMERDGEIVYRGATGTWHLAEVRS